MAKRPDIIQLEKKAIDIRRSILKMLAEAGSGHTGGSLSEVEILLALYYYKLRHDPKKPEWPNRDRFILSKGHGCPALYAILADSGYYPKKELMTLRKFGSRLQGHPQFVGRIAVVRAVYDDVRSAPQNFQPAWPAGGSQPLSAGR